ncbi:hypothetical protein [Nannocystis pusilla]|uniref:hypothetical protein n=1 Tax=Nannocystis pusilla TaxID=889268 RepID=UPI003B7DCE49
MSLWTARASAQEVLIEADASPRPPEYQVRKVHGDIRFGAGFGFVAEDPIFSAQPSLGLDLRDIAPVQLRLGAPVHIRMYDRDPEQGPVVRNTEWDEAGDYLAILQRLQYSGDYVFGREGRVLIDLRVGDLQRVQVGHGSMVRGYANSLDLDRRRSGVDLDARIEGLLLEHPAGAEIAFVAGDLAGQQIFGTRIAADWAGAALGFSVFGDPYAPRTLVPWDGRADALTVDSKNRLQTSGSLGAMAMGLDLSYRWTDRWRFLVTPYLDLNLMPGLGKGMHLGLDTEFILGRRRRARLGVVAELTVGDRGYDPTYFDVFTRCSACRRSSSRIRATCRPTSRPPRCRSTASYCRTTSAAWAATARSASLTTTAPSSRPATATGRVRSGTRGRRDSASTSRSCNCRCCTRTAASSGSTSSIPRAAWPASTSTCRCCAGSTCSPRPGSSTRSAARPERRLRRVSPPAGSSAVGAHAPRSRGQVRLVIMTCPFATDPSDRYSPAPGRGGARRGARRAHADGCESALPGRTRREIDRAAGVVLGTMQSSMSGIRRQGAGVQGDRRSTP